jgi:site-specific DNA recombinase
MKVAGYIRVSTQSQAQQGESLKTQEKQIRGFVESKNWKLTKIYRDEGLSGFKAENRPSFQEMISAGKSGKFQGIVFTKLSRFARRTSDFLKYRDELKEKDVLLFSIKEGVDPTSKMGKMILSFMALIAEWEKETIQEQMNENKMARWREGRTMLGKAPFGYRWNKQDKVLEIVPAEAEIYKRVVDWYLNLGLSYRLIALRLKNEGIRCKKKPFSSATISYMLKNPAYYGHYIQNKYVYVDGKRGAGNKRSKELKPESEWIDFPIPHIIDKSKWDEIQAKIQFNKVKSKRTTPANDPFWLRDVLECGLCGAKIAPRLGAKRKDGKAPRYYNCHWRAASPKELELKGKQKCDLPLIKAASLEREVWEWVAGTLFYRGRGSREFVEERVREKLEPLIDPERYKKQIEDVKSRINRLKKDRDKLTKASGRLYDALESGTLDADELSRRLRKNKDQQLKINAEIQEAETKKAELREIEQDDQFMKDFINNKKDVLDQLARDVNSLGPDDRKRLVEGVIKGRLKIITEEVEPGTEYYVPVVHWQVVHRAAGFVEVLKALMAEGRVNLFPKNSSHHPAADQL